MTFNAWQRAVLKAVLFALTVLGILSLGGLLIFLFLPLAVGYWWAARHSRPLERAAWIVLGAVAAGVWAWEITYPVTEGETPSSWIVAMIGAAAMAFLLSLGVHYRVVRNTNAAA